MTPGNAVLEALTDTDPGWGTHRLRQVRLERGDVLAETGRPIDQVLFPTSGMISLVVELSSGDRIEAGILGYRNVLGAAAAFGQRRHIAHAIAQIPGIALAVNVDDFAALATPNERARTLLHAHEQMLRAQAQQTAACNAKHHIPGRLATWLLRVRDAVGTARFDITQEFVAEMLGVQRASVSLVASELQYEGLVRYRRGHVELIDVAGLTKKACECYAVLERTHRVLLEPHLPASHGAARV